MKSVQCRACGRPIVFLPTAGGRSIPVNVETMSPGETVFMPGKHISHFSDCPAADQFRKKKPEPEPTEEQPTLFGGGALEWEHKSEREEIAYSRGNLHFFVIQKCRDYFRLSGYIIGYTSNPFKSDVNFEFYPPTTKSTDGRFPSMYEAKQKANSIAKELELI